MGFHESNFLLIFLPVAFFGFVILSRARSRRLSIAWLLIGSLFFYALGGASHLALIIGSILFNYQVAGLAKRSKIIPIASKLCLIAGIAINLSLLFVYKYIRFAAISINSITGWDLNFPSLLLPLAISFFTFQQIAFLVLAFREGKQHASLLEYALYVSFFPQLIAGPIVQPDQMIPQIKQAGFGKIKGDMIAAGLTLFFFGLVKKLIFADNLSSVADPAFALAADGSDISLITAWIGLLAFGFQIYFDFSAYSDMALGLARCFGIILPENFASPYQSKSVIDFWRRWHITLSSFFKHYVYIPLGGNRSNWLRTHINLIATMLLAGLWHGASWTFIAWGAAHGLLLSINHIWRCFNIRLPGSVCWFLAFFSVMLCWTFFRAESFDAAFNFFRGLYGNHSIFPSGSSMGEYLSSLIHNTEWSPLVHSLINHRIYPESMGGVLFLEVIFSKAGLDLALLVFSALLVLCFARPLTWLTSPCNGKPQLTRKSSILCVLAILLLVINLGSYEATPFIYFRF